MTDQRISGDEIVFRRIPPGTPYFEPPDRVSLMNFTLNRRRSDIGLSVYRKSAVTANEVLSKPEAIPGSFLMFATVAEIRSLKSAGGEALHLDVVRVADQDDPGHAEIRGPTPGVLTKSASKALRDAFKTYSTP